MIRGSLFRRAFPWIAATIVGCLGGLCFLKYAAGRNKPLPVHSPVQSLDSPEFIQIAELERTKAIHYFLGKYIGFKKIPQAEIKTELARRLSISPEALRTAIATGRKKPDPLTRCRSELLAGDPKAAILSSYQVEREQDLSNERRLEVLRVKAEAEFEVGDAYLAFSIRELIAAAADRETQPQEWAEAQALVVFTALTERRYSKGEQIMKEVISVQEKLFGADAPTVAASLSILAQVVMDGGDLSEAELLYRRALSIHEAKLGRDDSEVATDLMNLGDLLLIRKSYAEAEAVFRRALGIDEVKLGKDHGGLVLCLERLAAALIQQGNHQAAGPLLLRAVAIEMEKQGDLGVTGMGNLLFVRDQLIKDGRQAELEPIYRRFIQIREGALGKDHPRILPWISGLAHLLKDQGRLDEAEALFRQVIAARERESGRYAADLITPLDELAALRSGHGDAKEAESLWRRAIAIAEDNPSEERSDLERPSIFSRGIRSPGANDSSLAVLGNHKRGDSDRRQLNLMQPPAQIPAAGQEMTQLLAQQAWGDNNVQKTGNLELPWLLDRLGSLFEEQGRLAEAEPLVRKELLMVLRTGNQSGKPMPAEAELVKRYSALLGKMGRAPEMADAEIGKLKAEAGLKE